ncbi:conserved protein of unknown function [Thermococcus nautili]|uniref:DUF257 family protein n=1 Tax=Thermococcus nautili TaxID=195522 RepID=UPI00255520C1|nr:DUF257 family protein [Thermococcus nautili]CAI1492575.1 conserved protein of unknown function [Thermococcus nautili]
MLGDIINGLWDSLRPGEIVLIERTDVKDQYFGLHQLITWGLSKGYTILVVDVVDSLHLLKAKAKLAGFDGETFENVNVIKIGGKIKTGKVIAWISDLSEPVILVGKFREVYEKFLDEHAPVLTIALGVEKLFVTSEIMPKNVHIILSLVSQYVGNEKRLAVHFIKASLLDENRKFLLGLLEDIATTVIRVESDGRMTRFDVVKSIKKEMQGVSIRV